MEEMAETFGFSRAVRIFPDAIFLICSSKKEVEGLVKKVINYLNYFSLTEIQSMMIFISTTTDEISAFDVYQVFGSLIDPVINSFLIKTLIVPTDHGHFSFVQLAKKIKRKIQKNRWRCVTIVEKDNIWHNIYLKIYLPRVLIYYL